MRVIRWIIVVVAVIEILGGVMQLLAPAPDATAVNQETGGNVTQEAINENDSRQKQGKAAVVVLWISVAAVTLYFEKKSVKNKKLRSEDASSTSK